MGFSRPQVEEALMATGGDADLAAERLMTQVSENLRKFYLLLFFFFFFIIL